MMPSVAPGPVAETQVALTARKRGSGVHRVAPPVELPREGTPTAAVTQVPESGVELRGNSDWDRLVETWQDEGYGDVPPNCMAEYADAVIDAMKR